MHDDVDAPAAARTNGRRDPAPAEPDAFRVATIPVTVGVVGASGAGKTSLVERLVPCLAARGLRVGTAKHAPHGFLADRPGSDSDRHREAGADPVLLLGPQGLVVQRRDAPSLEHLARDWAGGADLLLAEGFHDTPGPKVLVHRRGVPRRAPRDPAEVVVAVTDEPLGYDHELPPDAVDEVAAILADLVPRNGELGGHRPPHRSACPGEARRDRP